MLITLEGIDGSGKSTVAAALEEIYPTAIHTREPTDSWYGAAVERSVADEEADPLAELFLYTADHAAHLTRVVGPALADGDLVISDRYSDSRYAYQAASISGRIERPLEFIQMIHEPWTRPPDVTIYLDVDAETGARRSGATNKFERASFLERVRENYLRLIEREPARFVRIDATRPAEEVIDAARTAVDDRL